MISHEEVQAALATFQQYVSENRAPMRRAVEMTDAQAAAYAAALNQDDLEHEIHGQTLFTVVANWVTSHERWSNEYWAVNRQEAEAMAKADAQATWEQNGMEGPAQFLIAGTYVGRLVQADTGVKTSEG